MSDKFLPDESQDSFQQSQLNLEFGFQISVIKLIDLFQQIVTKHGFDMIEKEKSSATAVKQNTKSFFQSLDCFSLLTDGHMTAIKIILHTNQLTSTRVCTVRGLVGSRCSVENIMKQFKIESKKLAQIQKALHPQEMITADIADNPFHLQACAAYMFHKILANENYGVGQILSKSLTQFTTHYLQAEKEEITKGESSKKVMRQAVGIVKQSVDSLFRDFNSARKQMDRIMPYCRISVEKYVFQRLQSIIKPIYQTKHKHHIFTTKVQSLFKLHTVSKVMQQIELKQQFWLWNKNYNDQINIDRFSIRQNSKYKKAIFEMQKISYICNPRQKMKHWQLSYCGLRGAVYQNIKQEINSMETVLPVLILSLLLTGLQFVGAELAMVAEFLQANETDYDQEKRIIFNYQHAYQYIVNQLNPV